MREREPFTFSDLEELHTELFSRADRVVPMRDVAKGDTGRTTIGLRHDVDDNPGALDTAFRLAEWECEHGYSSTYYLLHGSHYWDEEMLLIAHEIEDLGHEVGLHVNAIAEALRLKRDPAMIVDEALTYLRSAVKVRGCVAHGDPLCRAGGGIRFVNDEVFSECARPDVGPATRTLSHSGFDLRLAPLPLTTFDLEYDANWLSRGDYLSDSGGRWSQPFEDVVERWPELGQLHILIHPDWWSEAFAVVAV